MTVYHKKLLMVFYHLTVIIFMSVEEFSVNRIYLSFFFFLLCQRPRKIGAKFTGSNIAPDEYIVPEVKQDFEGKRDTWNGFDPEEHQRKLHEDYREIEEV